MDLKICDSHNDFLTELEIDNLLPYIGKSRKEGAEIICSSYWSSEKKESYIKKELALRANILRKESNYLLHIEDLWWVKNEKDLQFLLELHPFSCSLTWNNDNLLAGGAKAEGNLTNWGKRCLEQMIKQDIIIDVAHLNKKSFYAVTKICNKNIYCSHTGFYGYKKHKRNLTDKQIELIVKSGGFIGLFFYDKCISRKNTFCIDEIVNNLKYFVSKWGYDNIGIGSDFYGIENYPLGLEDYCDFVKLQNALLIEGFTKDQINKIFYQNFKTFLSRCK